MPCIRRSRDLANWKIFQTCLKQQVNCFFLGVNFQDHLLFIDEVASFHLYAIQYTKKGTQEICHQRNILIWTISWMTNLRIQATCLLLLADISRIPTITNSNVIGINLPTDKMHTTKDLTITIKVARTIIKTTRITKIKGLMGTSNQLSRQLRAIPQRRLLLLLHWRL